MARPKKSEPKDEFDILIAAANKEFGAGAVFDLGKLAHIPNIPKVSYGSVKIDLASGGGAGKGRIIEIFGEESSGKTTICLELIKSAQQDPDYIKEGRRALFIDAEHALDLRYATEDIGVDKENLIVSQPSTGEGALQLADMFIRSGKISVCVIDSVSTLVPAAELAGEVGDTHVGLQARMMGQALRKISGICSQTNTILIFTNQIRHKIGVMFGNPETTSGGNALKFYASHRIKITRAPSQATKDSDGNTLSIPTTLKFVKNKLFPPFRTAVIDIKAGVGIDLTAEILDLGEQHDFIARSGAWYSTGEKFNGTEWEGKRVGQGRHSAIAFLDENPDLLQEVEKGVRSVLFSPQDDTAEEAEPES